jgi:hypothetical protein
MHVAVLDDYQSVALKMADWSLLRNRAEVTVFNDHLADEDASGALGAVRYRLCDAGADSFAERPHWEAAKVVIWRSLMR